MTVKAFQVQQLQPIDEDTFALTFDSKKDATQCLKKNPRAQYLNDGDDEHILIYKSSEIDLGRAVKKA